MQKATARGLMFLHVIKPEILEVFMRSFLLAIFVFYMPYAIFQMKYGIWLKCGLFRIVRIVE